MLLDSFLKIAQQKFAKAEREEDTYALQELLHASKERGHLSSVRKECVMVLVHHQQRGPLCISKPDLSTIAKVAGEY